MKFNFTLLAKKLSAVAKIISGHQLQVASYQLPVAACQLPIANCQLTLAGWNPELVYPESNRREGLCPELVYPESNRREGQSNLIAIAGGQSEFLLKTKNNKQGSAIYSRLTTDDSRFITHNS